jgi:nicotinamidase-related amidase
VNRSAAQDDVVSAYTEPNWAAAALLIIDMQPDFAEGGASPIPGTAAVAPVGARLAAGFRSAGLPIAHIVRLYRPGGTDVDLPRRAAIEAGLAVVAPGSPGSGIIPGIADDSAAPYPLDATLLLTGRPQPIRDREIALFKPRWGAFYRTELDAWLRAQGSDTLVVAGCNLPNCPRATLFEASERDFRTVLAADAVSQTTPERLGDLAAIGVNLLPTDTIISHLARRPTLPRSGLTTLDG